MTAANPHPFENKVYMGEPAIKNDISEIRLIHAAQRPEDSGVCIQYVDPVDNLDADSFLQLHGRNLPAQPLFATEENRTSSVLVAKHSRRSGLRSTNDIEAVWRTPFTEDSRSIVSLHLLVLDFELDRFSVRSDLGSCVFDPTGRVLGLIDAGARTKEMMEQDALPEGLPPLTASARVADLKAQKELGEAPPDVTYATPIQ